MATARRLAPWLKLGQWTAAVTAQAAICHPTALAHTPDPPAQSPPSDSLEGLISRARRGDEPAFEELVNLHREQVYAVAWQVTRSREDALDVTQEAFLRAWRALGSYSGRSRFTTWLHRIVLNTAIDYIRREARHQGPRLDDHPSAPGEAPPPREPATRATQRDAIYETQINKQILSAIAKLSRRQGQVFLLRYYHELSLNEIAATVHSSLGTVKRHLSRAQARLRELLADLRGPDPGK